MEQGSQTSLLQHIPGHGPRGHPKGGHLTLQISGSGFLTSEREMFHDIFSRFYPIGLFQQIDFEIDL
jgi:hypothetical protein